MKELISNIASVKCGFLSNMKFFKPIHLLVLVNTSAVVLGFPLQAKAGWLTIGYDDIQRPIYINSESVYIKGNLRGAEIRSATIGRALFVVNCSTNNYYIQTNRGKTTGYAAPGTVAGVIAAEICENYR
ncbi:hypothetical protein F7734_07995 [Scytonema sp. UIC 10036]|uniref:hypothetical protein n=1 Tax=Scytonema sp. UIC 10036 TaxID=2304196 RepID=UPI0012DA2D88|nr:hypothetical protein [Scytonema sp. UIC 10036]MUG92400.1 hypothetical protein [Scytonema sp. UIC 10036]